MKALVKGESSEHVAVDSGVPQGTVLRPSAFFCHINDLPNSPGSSHFQSLENWTLTWEMRFMAKKCYVMNINSKSSHFTYYGFEFTTNGCQMAVIVRNTNNSFSLKP